MANQLQNKLNQFEVTPPAGVWEKIADSLDDESYPSFVQRLQTYEVMPDQENWSRIEASLSDQQAKPGFFKRFHKLFVYSSAAAAIVFIVVLITLLIPGRSISNETKGNKLITQSSVQKNASSDKEGATKAEKEDGHYVTLVKDDGKKVKLSKKVLSVYNCATNEVNERCKERIEKLQDKMASSMVSPSVDFAGIVELVKNLNEDQ